MSRVLLTFCAAAMAAGSVLFLSCRTLTVAPTGRVRASQDPQVSEQIIVDQFGWRTRASRKVALIADPIQGQNAGHPFTPGDTFEIRRADDGRTVFTAKTAAWRNGDMDKVSGDK